MQCVAVCCSVLQCVAVCCSVLQCVAAYCCILQYIAVYCSVLQCIAVYCSVLQCIAVYCSVLLCIAVYCSVFQCIAVHCIVLQCIPLIEGCCIVRGLGNGIEVATRGLGVIKNNDIALNKRAGVDIRTGGDPVVERNRLVKNLVGLLCADQAKGKIIVFEKCSRALSLVCLSRQG